MSLQCPFFQFGEWLQGRFDYVVADHDHGSYQILTVNASQFLVSPTVNIQILEDLNFIVIESSYSFFVQNSSKEKIPVHHEHII